MKIESISAIDLPPIKHLDVDNLGTMIIIAGANGSGKTRFKEAIITALRSPQNPSPISFVLASTRPEEKRSWNADRLPIQRGASNQVLTNYMSSRTRGGTYTGTVIQISSNRSITNVNFQQLFLNTPDPDDLEIDSTFYLSPFSNRWGDIVNKIFQKVATRKNNIAQYNLSNPNGKIADALAKYPDPFTPYQKLFQELLPGKTLDPVDPSQLREFQYKIDGSDELLPFSSLSSGEQEVVKITFDLLWKKMTHCVFLIDEPELHLHPTLAFRLVETLRKLGKGTNQFIFFTHSADLISTYYATGNVFFIDAVKTGANQAHRLSALNAEHPGIVRLMSQNLGLVAVGKKLVFVEGEESSIDRTTYHAIAQKYVPDLYFIPAGSVENLMALGNVAWELETAIFGIDFLMVRDRDGLSDQMVLAFEAKSIRCLRKRHLENYFLDAQILAKIAQNFYIQDPETHDPEKVEQALLDIARRNLNDAVVRNIKEYIRLRSGFPLPRVKGVQNMSADEVKQALLGEASKGFQELANQLLPDALRMQIEAEYKSLDDSLSDGNWKSIFPGKMIFNIYCAERLHTDAHQVRQAFVGIALGEKPDIFLDIISILKQFSDKGKQFVTQAIVAEAE